MAEEKLPETYCPKCGKHLNWEQVIRKFSNGAMFYCPTCHKEFWAGEGAAAATLKEDIRNLFPYSTARRYERQVWDSMAHLLGNTPSDALALIEKTEDVWEGSIADLQKVAAGKKELDPDTPDYRNWRSAEGKELRPIPQDEWAQKFEIPRERQYLAQVHEARKVVETVIKKRAKSAGLLPSRTTRSHARLSR